MSAAARSSGGTLLLLTEAFRTPGGIQTFNRNLVAALRRIEPKHPPAALVLNDGPENVVCGEWAGLEAHGFARRKLRFALAAVAAARRLRPARVILGHRNFLPLAPWLRRIGGEKEIWLILHGIDARGNLGWLERGGLRSTHRVLAVSPQTAEMFRTAGCVLQTSVFPNSLPFSWTLPTPVPPVFAVPARLLTVARLEPGDAYKGVDVVIRALASVIRSGRQVGLDVVGDGGDRSRLETVARELGVASNVRFHGRVDDAALRGLFAACDLFVLPSGGEGFGIVYLEAMAHGKPVIAADAAAAPFVVRPGEGGFLVPFGDADALARCIAERVDDPEGSRRAGLAGRAFLEREFAFERFVGRLGELVADGR